jgi:hypothetical protein
MFIEYMAGFTNITNQELAAETAVWRLSTFIVG